MSIHAQKIMNTAKKIPQSVLSSAKFEVKGSIAIRETLSDKKMEEFVKQVILKSILNDSLSEKKLLQIYNKVFPGIEIHLIPNQDKTRQAGTVLFGDANQTINAYLLELPLKEENNELTLKLNKQNLIALFHETTHLCDFCHNSKYTATQNETTRKISRRIAKQAEDKNLSPLQKEQMEEFLDGLNEIKRSVRDTFYCNESENFEKFKTNYKKGGVYKEKAIAKRLKELDKSNIPIIDSIRPIRASVITLKYTLFNMILENNAFAKSELYAKQFQTTSLLIKASLRKLGTNDLEKLKTPEAKKIMKKLKASLDEDKIIERVNQKVEETNEIKYFFSRKIKYLKGKLAEELKYMRDTQKTELELKANAEK